MAHFAEVVVVSCFSLGVAHVEHGAAFVFHYGFAVAEGGGSYSEQCESSGGPVGSVGQLPQAEDPDGCLEGCAVAYRSL